MPGSAAAYKALPGGTYGCEREEAGGLALSSQASMSEALLSVALFPGTPGGTMLPRSLQASSPSREGHIISMRMQLSQSRCPAAPPSIEALLSQATQRRKR
jgi:hypothetical protein